MPAEFTGACDPQPQYAMFVSEVELERLNLARTADEVIATKLADVKTKLLLADKISLDRPAASTSMARPSMPRPRTRRSTSR